MRRMLLVVAGAAAVVGLSSSGALASAIHPNPVGHVIDVGPSPTGVPGNCPFANGDASFQLVSGNVVVHNSSNKNGDWGGVTFEGTAIFQDAPFSGFDSMGNPIDIGPPVALYEGRLTYSIGNGNNAGGQGEGGMQVDFRGSGPGGSLVLHVNAHMTTNNGGTSTANVVNVNFTCS